MATAKLEDRVAALEIEFERLKKQLVTEKTAQAIPWYDKVFGTFRDDSEYDEAMRLGREYRSAQRPDYDNEPDLA